jgi:predicted glycoside hydrolase/deacetylase ChbG (UPF0249 family)
LSQIALQLAARNGVGAIRHRAHGLALWQGLPLTPGRLLARCRLGFMAATPPRTTDHLLVLTALGRRLSVPAVRRLLYHLPPGVTELVTHPGYVDEELCRLDPLREPRERELRLLRSDDWRRLLEERKLRLTSFAGEVARWGAALTP